MSKSQRRKCRNLLFFQLCTEEHAEATIVSGAVIVEVEGDSKEDWEKPGEDQESVEAVLVQPDGGTCAADLVMVIVMGWDLWSELGDGDGEGTCGADCQATNQGNRRQGGEGDAKE